MNTIIRCLLLMVALVALMIPATASAQDTAAQNDGRLRIDLSGFDEVHGPSLGIGTIFSAGRGRLPRSNARPERPHDGRLVVFGTWAAPPRSDA